MVTRFETKLLRPEVAGGPEVGNITATSRPDFNGQVNPDGSETYWRFEYATSRSGPWTPAAGASGTTPAEENPTLGSLGFYPVEADITGLEESEDLLRPPVCGK